LTQYIPVKVCQGDPDGLVAGNSPDQQDGNGRRAVASFIS
jgi:hypothetical protein